MALSFAKIRCHSLTCSAQIGRTSTVPKRATDPQRSPLAPSTGRHARHSRVQRLQAADTASDVIKLSLPAEEVLATLKINQRKDGMFIIEDVIADSTAGQKSVEKGSVLKAVSDPAAPGNMWQLEPRSNLRHVLDQMRMQQSATVNLEILPPSAADEDADGRTGFDKGSQSGQDGIPKQWNQRIDEKTMQRRQDQREAYLSKEGTTNQTNWLIIGAAVFLAPTIIILAYAIQSGFLDQMNAGWRQGM